MARQIACIAVLSLMVGNVSRSDEGPPVGTLVMAACSQEASPYLEPPLPLPPSAAAPAAFQCTQYFPLVPELCDAACDRAELNYAPAWSVRQTSAASQPRFDAVARMEFLTQAAQHLRQIGQDDAAAICESEAEGLLAAARDILTEKRRDSERLQREISHLEKLTGSGMLVINVRCASATVAELEMCGWNEKTLNCLTQVFSPTALGSATARDQQQVRQLMATIGNSQQVGRPTNMWNAQLATMDGKGAFLRYDGMRVSPAAAADIVITPSSLGADRVRLQFAALLEGQLSASSAIQTVGATTDAAAIIDYSSRVSFGEAATIAVWVEPMGGGERELLVMQVTPHDVPTLATVGVPPPVQLPEPQ